VNVGDAPEDAPTVRVPTNKAAAMLGVDPALLDPEATARSKSPDGPLARASRAAQAALALKNASAQPKWVRPAGLVAAVMLVLGLVLWLVVGRH
jgi:hypothetical protein